ncbi:MAG: nicotinate-nucleotide adenylyltransferase [Massilia sp.]|nr:nicotinate-nucleotide adenylyltransferase [Massilia sp.]
MTRCIALLGGSFDPVHHGHVALAELFARLLRPDELRVMPAGQPWQKKNGLEADDADRVAMLELAFTASCAPVVVDTREIDRQGATYTVETLREVRAELDADASIVFLMGADQLQKLDTWSDWRDLFALANFGVAARPGYRLDDAGLPPAVAAELAQRRASCDDVRASPAGKVCVAHTLAVDISATQVRAALHATPRTDTVPNLSALVAPQVLDYIQQHNLYKN